jgi:hypothetical protein
MYDTLPGSIKSCYVGMESTDYCSHPNCLYILYKMADLYGEKLWRGKKKTVITSNVSNMVGIHNRAEEFGKRMGTECNPKKGILIRMTK